MNEQTNKRTNKTKKKKKSKKNSESPSPRPPQPPPPTPHHHPSPKKKCHPPDAPSHRNNGLVRTGKLLLNNFITFIVIIVTNACGVFFFVCMFGFVLFRSSNVPLGRPPPLKKIIKSIENIYQLRLYFMVTRPQTGSKRGISSNSIILLIIFLLLSLFIFLGCTPSLAPPPTHICIVV